MKAREKENVRELVSGRRMDDEPSIQDADEKARHLERMKKPDGKAATRTSAIISASSKDDIMSEAKQRSATRI
jgi:hypothetical protein